MSNQIEQLRAEVVRRIKSWEAGVKYEGDAGDCQSRVTELTDLRKFIDALQAQAIPEDVQEAANQYIGYPHEVDEGVSTSMRRDAYAAGMLAERNRLMGGSLRGVVEMCGISAWVELPSKELTDFLRSNFKEGDEVRVIIIKEVGK